jgi:uncharacterized protein YqfB (UPF0267 family)
MEMGELVAVAFIKEELEKCPFTEEIVDSGVSEVDPEDIENDDKKAARKEQENNGGTLGKNLSKGEAGSKGTVGGPYPPDGYLKTDQPLDSKPDRGKQYVYVEGADEYDDGAFPYVVAAHHLIPGKGSLALSDLKPFMTKDESVQTESGKSWKIACHIGYNVNGAHNGIWLPGNYAIRKPSKSWYKSPDASKKWSELGDHAWCTNYVAAVSKVTQRQFHDAHKQYNEAVRKLLNKISTKLYAHQDKCEKCAKKMNGKITPPYFIKQRLYNISNYLHRQLTGAPNAWKRPWYASDKWRDKVYSPASGKVDSAFLNAYDSARSVTK